jgi:hypothetical protein
LFAHILEGAFLNFTDFLAFYFHVGVIANPNPSNPPELDSGRFLTPEKFASLVTFFNPYREEIEKWLRAFPRDRMFFDDYCYSAPIPTEVELEARALIGDFLLPFTHEDSPVA